MLPPIKAVASPSPQPSSHIAKTGVSLPAIGNGSPFDDQMWEQGTTTPYVEQPSASSALAYGL